LTEKGTETKPIHVEVTQGDNEVAELSNVEVHAAGTKINKNVVYWGALGLAGMGAVGYVFWKGWIPGMGYRRRDAEDEIDFTPPPAAGAPPAPNGDGAGPCADYVPWFIDVRDYISTEPQNEVRVSQDVSAQIHTHRGGSVQVAFWSDGPWIAVGHNGCLPAEGPWQTYDATTEWESITLDSLNGPAVQQRVRDLFLRYGEDPYVEHVDVTAMSVEAAIAWVQEQIGAGFQLGNVMVTNDYGDEFFSKYWRTSVSPDGFSLNGWRNIRSDRAVSAITHALMGDQFLTYSSMDIYEVGMEDWIDWVQHSGMIVDTEYGSAYIARDGSIATADTPGANGAWWWKDWVVTYGPKWIGRNSEALNQLLSERATARMEVEAAIATWEIHYDEVAAEAAALRVRYEGKLNNDPAYADDPLSAEDVNRMASLESELAMWDHGTFGDPENKPSRPELLEELASVDAYYNEQMEAMPNNGFEIVVNPIEDHGWTDITRHMIWNRSSDMDPTQANTNIPPISSTPDIANLLLERERNMPWTIKHWWWAVHSDDGPYGDTSWIEDEWSWVDAPKHFPEPFDLSAVELQIALDWIGEAVDAVGTLQRDPGSMEASTNWKVMTDASHGGTMILNAATDQLGGNRWNYYQSTYGPARIVEIPLTSIADAEAAITYYWNQWRPAMGPGSSPPGTLDLNSVINEGDIESWVETAFQWEGTKYLSEDGLASVGSPAFSSTGEGDGSGSGGFSMGSGGVTGMLDLGDITIGPSKLSRELFQGTAKLVLVEYWRWLRGDVSDPPLWYDFDTIDTGQGSGSGGMGGSAGSSHEFDGTGQQISGPAFPSPPQFNLIRAATEFSNASTTMFNIWPNDAKFYAGRLCIRYQVLPQYAGMSIDEQIDLGELFEVYLLHPNDALPAGCVEVWHFMGDATYENTPGWFWTTPNHGSYPDRAWDHYDGRDWWLPDLFWNIWNMLNAPAGAGGVVTGSRFDSYFPNNIGDLGGTPHSPRVYDKDAPPPDDPIGIPPPPDEDTTIPINGGGDSGNGLVAPEPMPVMESGPEMESGPTFGVTGGFAGFLDRMLAKETEDDSELIT
jgi:hypothetical protein